MIGAEEGKLTGTRKAAILLSVLGEDAVAPVLRGLAAADLERIAEEITRMRQVPLTTTVEVLEEHQKRISEQEGVTIGGEDAAVRLLERAVGANGAKDIVERLAQASESRTFRVEELRKADPQQLARFLTGERPQTKALVLRHLDARKASALLMQLEPEVRSDCMRRMARLGNFSPEVAAKVSRVLDRRLRSTGDQPRSSGNGLRNIADVLNRMEPTAAKEVLESIEREEPQLAVGIRDLMFTFENFLEVPEEQMRELMNSIDKKTLMVALKGASEDLRSHFYRTMSSRAVEMMREDSEAMGPVRGKEASKAQAEIVAIARKLEEEGKIALKSEEEDDYVL